MSKETPRPAGLPIKAAMTAYSADQDTAARYRVVARAIRIPQGFHPPPHEVELTPLGALAAHQVGLFRHLQEALLPELVGKLRSGALIARGFQSGSLAIAEIPAEWWATAEINVEDGSASAHGIRVAGILVFEADDHASPEPSRDTPGPKPSVQMVAALDRMLAAGKTFTTKVAAHKAVMEELGLTETPRGFSYDTFVRQAGDRLSSLA